jgi:hypothetical protein
MEEVARDESAPRETAFDTPRALEIEHRERIREHAALVAHRVEVTPRERHIFVIRVGARTLRQLHGK